MIQIYLLLATMLLQATSLQANTSIHQKKKLPITEYIRGRAESASHKQSRFILTGGPCVGKTTTLLHLQRKGWPGIREAATDIILESFSKGVAKPWEAPEFGTYIVKLQEKRQQEAAHSEAAIVFFDRSPIDTLSYALMREHEEVGETILHIVQEIIDSQFYEKKVFLIEALESYRPDEVRSESCEERLYIEQELEKNYRALGFEVIRIPAAAIEQRVQWIADIVKEEVKQHLIKLKH